MNLKNGLIMSLFAGSIFMTGCAFAASAPAIYQLKYMKEDNQGPDLKDVQVNVHLFESGTPKGFKKVKTNEEGKIELNGVSKNHLVVEVSQIEGEKKLKKRCYGYSKFGSDEIPIQCSNR